MLEPPPNPFVEVVEGVIPPKRPPPAAGVVEDGVVDPNMPVGAGLGAAAAGAKGLLEVCAAFAFPKPEGAVWVVAAPNPGVEEAPKPEGLELAPNPLEEAPKPGVADAAVCAPNDVAGLGAVAPPNILEPWGVALWPENMDDPELVELVGLVIMEPLEAGCAGALNMEGAVCVG